MPKTRKQQELDEAQEEIKKLKAQLRQAKALEKIKQAKAASDSDVTADVSTDTAEISTAKAPSRPQARSMNPKAAKNSAKRPAPARDDEDDSAFVQDALEGKSRRQQSVGGMKKVIKEEVNGLWRVLKVIKGKKMQTAAAEKLLAVLDFKCMQGDDPEAKAAKKDWIKIYGPEVTKALNDKRSYVQTQIKEVCYKWWLAHEKTLPPLDDIVRILKRDLNFEPPKDDTDPQDDTELFRWWWLEILPKATGNGHDWGVDKRLYACPHNGAPEANPNALYIPPSTESMAAFLIANNYENWPLQWQAKNAHPRCTNTIKKIKDDDNRELDDDEHKVNIF